jgi:hypothetical protein
LRRVGKRRKPRLSAEGSLAGRDSASTARLVTEMGGDGKRLPQGRLKPAEAERVLGMSSAPCPGKKIRCKEGQKINVIENQARGIYKIHGSSGTLSVGWTMPLLA